MPAFVLVHSPLVGPYTWKLVGKALSHRGYAVATPELRSPAGATEPYWQLHTAVVANAAHTLPAASPLVIVAHSGAGALVPSSVDALRDRVAAAIFVDAGLPHPGRSRLETFEDAAMARQWRESARAGMLRPPWSDADLRPIVPANDVRAAFLADIEPSALETYTEPMSPSAMPADVTCAYLLFSPAYRPHFEQARRLSWPARDLPGNHFHMLVDPEAVATTLIDMATT